MSEEPLRAAIYARISRDREGAGINVATQIQDCREYCKKNGYEVVAVHSDNDESAWSGKPRPGYDDLKKDMRDLVCDVVVILHIDRLTRSVRDLEDIIDIAYPRDIPIMSLRNGVADLSTASGQFSARLGAILARHESDQKAERLRRKHQQLAVDGKPASLRGSFGYSRDGSLNTAQAAVIREMAERILLGESLRSVTAWLAESGTPTAKGGSWSSSTVKQILTSGRICGWREWTPRTPIGPERKGWDGRPRRGHGDGPLAGQGDWEAIISLEEHEALRALLLNPSRKTTRRQHYLLSAGILKCSLCGKSMNHKTETQRSSKRDANGARIVLRQVSRYACIKQSGRGCGKMSISCPDVDDFVAAAVLHSLTNVNIAPRNGVESAEVARARNRLQALRVRLNDVDEQYANLELEKQDWLRIRAGLQENIAETQGLVVDVSVPAVVNGLPRGKEALEQAWVGLSLDRRRAVIKAVVARIDVLPAKPQGERPRSFDPDRLRIHWLA